MSPRSWRIRIQDMLQAIEELSMVITHKDQYEFESDRKAVLASVACIQIMGEACNHVPDEIKIKYTEIPWAQIRGMRNKIAHEYFELDVGILWLTCKKDVPSLKPKLQKILDLDN